MEYDELERSVRNLNVVLDEFPIGAISLDDFKPIGEKIRAARESLMRLNARLLLLKAKSKRTSLRSRGTAHISNGRSEMHHVTFAVYAVAEDGKARQPVGEIGDLLQRAVSDTLLNASAVKLCLHSTTILSVLGNKEGDAEDRK